MSLVLDGWERLGVPTRCCLLQAGTVVMGTSFPTPYEAVVDKTKGLSVRGLAWLAPRSGHLKHSCDRRINRTALFLTALDCASRVLMFL